MHSDSALLLSGGIESACLAWWTRPKIAYTVDYGQVVADAEARASSSICHALGITHVILKAKTGFMKTGLLAGQAEGTKTEEAEFWPFRNQFIITCALMRAYEDDIKHIMIGSVKNDTKFKDGSPEFIRQMSSISEYQSGAKVSAPASDLTSIELIRLSNTPKSILGLTFSCHTSNIPCGQCPGCRKNRDLLYCD